MASDEFHLQTGPGRKATVGRHILLASLLAALVIAFTPRAIAADPAAPASSVDIAAEVPDAPTPDSDSQSAPASSSPAQRQPALSFPSATPDKQAKQKTPKPLDSCEIENTGATVANTGAVRALAVSGLGVVSPRAGSTPVSVTLCLPHMPLADWYARFLNGPEVKQLTPAQKAYLAAHNLLDPFNLLTIAGEAAISVAANSHSSYGPGVPGWARYMGVSFTQDMTGEFFGTFLIPSIVHQDPHYHRMPTATIKHRIFHAAIQVLWTQGDNGQGMVNYANIVGFALDDAIGDLYVPGQRTNLSSSASRYFIGLATAPIDNYVTEFLPDVARHLHIQIVVIQRVINQVARSDNTAQ